MHARNREYGYHKHIPHHSHNATVQRLNTRVASANDALLKQQASHAEKDEALEQARLQIQQLQITNKGLKVLFWWSYVCLLMCQHPVFFQTPHQQ